MLQRPLPWIAALGVVAVGLSGCATGSGTTGATASSSASSPTTTASPTSTASSPTTTASPTSTGSPTTTTTTSLRPRTAAQLKSALLELADLPSGFALEPSGAGGDDDGSSSSRNPKCAALVKLTNADVAPGSRASAKVSLSGGQSGPFVEESIDAMGSAESVKALLASVKSAVAACGRLTVTIPGQGTSTMKVAEVSAPQFGDHPVAARMTAAGGPLDGLEITQVTTGVKDTVVAITFIMASPDEVDGATQDAVEKAEAVLDGAKSGA